MTRVQLPFGPCEVRLDGNPDAPAVLLVHGVLVNGSVWDPIVPALAEHYRVIRPDLPIGAHDVPAEDRRLLHPEAVADALADLLGALGVERAVVAGSDTGGALAQILTARHPDRVRALVLLSCDAFDHFPPTVFKPVKLLLAVPGLVDLGAVVYRPRWMRRSALGAGMLLRKPIDDAVIDPWFERFITSGAVRRDMAAFVRRCRPALAHAAADRLADLDVPVLIAWSKGDLVFPESDARRLQARLRNSHLHFVEHARTFAQIDQPDAVLALVLPFLRDVDARTPGRLGAT